MAFVNYLFYCGDMRTDQLHHIRQFNRLYTEKLGILDRNVFGSGLSWAQARALMLVASGQARTPADTTRLLGVDKSYVSRLVDSLARGGYLTKKVNSADARSRLLETTRKGSEAFDYLEKRSDTQLRALFAGLSDAQQDTVYQAFDMLDGLLFDKEQTHSIGLEDAQMRQKTTDDGWFDETLDQMPASRLLGELELRAAVFAVDQRRIYQDPDETDRIAHHIAYVQERKVLAYARVFPAAPDKLESSANQHAPVTRTSDTAAIDVNHDEGLTQVSFGRVVTAKEVRGQGLGAELMRHVLGCVERHYPDRLVYMHTQQPVIGFYEKFGFTQESEPFLLAGSPHVLMEHAPLHERR